MAGTNVYFPKPLFAEVSDHIDDDDSISSWVQHAAREQLNREKTESSGSRPEEGVA